MNKVSVAFWFYVVFLGVLFAASFVDGSARRIFQWIGAALCVAFIVALCVVPSVGDEED